LKVLVTGCAGFIGAALSQRLLARGDEVLGIDSLNNYYDVRLKFARLERLRKHPNFSFFHANIAYADSINPIFKVHRPARVVNLAAQAGVRYSLTHPHAYIDANVTGFLNILEACRHHEVESLVYASSSSVYGANEDMPFSEDRMADHPVALYGATKRANELMAHAYSHLFNLPTTGLRFFSVYGPWGRPDMALFVFTQRMLNNEAIDVFNFGQHKRDFTYIDDIVEGIIKVLDTPAAADANWNPRRPNPSRSKAPFRVYNIGNNNQVELEEMIAAIESALGCKAIKNYLEVQAGDVIETLADVTNLEDDFGFRPQTDLREGIQRFVDWYQSDYLPLIEAPVTSSEAPATSSETGEKSEFGRETSRGSLFV